MKPEKRRAELYPTGGVWFGGRLSRTVLRTAVAFVVAAAMLVPALPAVAEEGTPGGTPAATPAETPAAAQPAEPSEPSAEPAVQQDVWVNGTSGDDSTTGADQSTALKTMAKALEVQKAHAEIKTIHITGSFTDWTKVEVPQGVTLRVEGTVSVAGNPGTAIALTSGSRMESAAGAALSMSLGDGNTAIDIAKNAVLSDGDYHFIFPKNGSAFRLVGDVIGSAAGSVKMDITNGYFQSYNPKGHLNNMVLNQRYDSDKWQLYEFNGFTAQNSQMNFYRLPFYVKGPVTLDNSTMTVDEGGVRYQTGFYFDNSWNVGELHITNKAVLEIKNFHTHWRAKGLTTGYGNKIRVDNGATLKFRNNNNGGLNINDGTAIFENGGTLDSAEHSGGQFGVQKGSIQFRGDSVVNTPGKSDADNGLGQDGTGQYIVTGGSHLVKYAPGYQSGQAIPTNGEENGNEKLYLFTLADTATDVINPVNKLGAPYEYKVKNASADGKKHVWVPAAHVSFKLNNGNATFADGSKATKNEQTIRGYNLGVVEGNAEVGTPVDSTGVKFLGWYYKDAQGAEQPFDFGATTFTADTDVYAKWDAKTIVYHNGSGVDYIQSVVASKTSASVLSYEDVEKAAEGFTPAGKTFSKWTKGASASSDELKPGDTLTFGEKETQLDVYAQFTDNVYRVAFSARGGTFGTSSVFKTNPDIFTIETDPLYGGEVAVVKAGAKYNQKLSEILGSFERKGITPTTAAIRRPGYILRDESNWYTNPQGTGKKVSFEPVSFWGITLSEGDDPSFTADTTYYLSWQDDPKVATVDSDVTIPSDLTGNSEIGQKDSTQPVKVDVTGSSALSISLTGQLDALKKQMLAISEKYADVAEDKISLSDLQTQLTYTYTLPDHVQAPAEVSAQSVKLEAEGMGELFEVKDAKAEGKTVTVTLGLKHSYGTYAELKKALTDTASEDTVLQPVRSAFARLLRADDAAEDIPLHQTAHLQTR